MIDLIRHLLATTPVVGALLLAITVNVPRPARVRQLPMPFLASVYAVAALVVLYVFNAWVGDLLGRLFLLVPLVRDWYDTTWLLIIENTAVVLVFVAIKWMLRPLLSRLFQDEDAFGADLVTDVYRFDPVLGIWCVRPGGAMLRVYLCVFFWASVATTVLLITLAASFASWPGFAVVSFPALAALVIGEWYFALNGVTEHEYRRDILGEADDAQRITNYAGLRDVFAATFPGRVIDVVSRLFSRDSTRTYDELDTFAHSPDETDRTAAGYFSRLKRGGGVLDVSLVAAAAGLMAGRSTVIGTPFYPDLTPYLVFPAYDQLLRHGRCLVVCGRDAAADDLVRWLRDGLESISGIPELWAVDLLTADGRADLDVGVLRFSDIHDLDLISANDAFFRDVRYVILAEPSRAMATGQLGLGLVFSRCGGAHAPVFAVFDRPHDGLVDALSHLLKTDLTDVVAPPAAHGVSSQAIWRAEGPHMQADVLPTVSRYLGMGVEIGALAIKYEVSRVGWVGSDAFPVVDMMWIAGQYYAPITAFAGLEMSQRALNEAITAHSNPWDLPVAENSFLVVEDEIHNAYESVRLFSTRAEQQGFVNVISDDYLLRDYMVDNSEIFAVDAKAIPSFAPDYARTERNLVLRLMLALHAFGMDEATLAREFELIGHALPPVAPRRDDDRDDDDADPPAVALLRELVARHTGIPIIVLDVRRLPAGVTADGVALTMREYRLRADADVERVLVSLRSVYFFVEDEVAEHEYVGAALHGLVHQRMMPGQFVVHAGKYYEVQSIGDDVRRNAVVLRRAAEHIRDRRVYRPLRTFALSGLREADRTGARVSIGDITLVHLIADVQVRAHGFVEAQRRGDLAHARQTQVSGIPSRHYANKEVLGIRLPGSSPQIRATIAVLLNELFVTVFPDAHDYVVALAADVDPAFGAALDVVAPGAGDAHDSGGSGEDEVVYIVEDGPFDMGLLIGVERNWRRFFEIVTDYLTWHETAPQDAQEEPATGQAVVVFPGETADDIARRARVAAEQDAAGGTPARRHRGRVWSRLWARVRWWFTRQPARRPDSTSPDADRPLAAPPPMPVAPPAPVSDTAPPVDLAAPSVAVDVGTDSEISVGADGTSEPVASETAGEAERGQG